MYPGVFADFVKFKQEYSDVSVLPSSAFLYGLRTGEEIAVDIEEGKTLFISLSHIGAVDKDGQRTLLFELNGRSRESTVTDKSVQATAKPRVKADPSDTKQVGAPIPGMVTTLAVSVGSKVAKGDKLLTLEAMKMQTTLYAPCNGVVEEVHAALGDRVDSKDLMVKLR